MSDEYIQDAPLRIDKWLLAARFFKTRSLAAKAVDGGRVRVNGEGAKPSRALKAGDELAIRLGELEWVVEVKALSRQRGPAAGRGRHRARRRGAGESVVLVATGELAAPLPE